MFTLRADPPRRLNAVAFSPDGARLAACGEMGAVKLWDLVTRAALKCPGAGRRSADRVFFAADGRELFVNRPGVLLALPLPAGKWSTRHAAADIVSSATPLGDGLAACFAQHGISRRLAVISLADGAPAWARPEGDAWHLACSADGRRVASVGGERVAVYDSATGEPVALHERPGEASPTALAISPDGSAAAFCAASNLHFLRLPEGTHAHHRLGKTHFLGVAWHPSGGFFATVNGDGKVDFWDGHTAERRGSFDWGLGKLTDITFDAAGDRAAACSESGHIILWDIDR